MSFEKFFTNMQTMLTWFSENKEILNESQTIRLIFRKIQNPILTQIKASINIYYDIDQANTLTYNFISNILVAEAAIIGEHNTQGVVYVNTCGKKAPDSGFKGSGGAIFTRF